MTNDIDMSPDPIKLMLAGDWHGDHMWAEWMIDHAKVNDVDVILQLGDLGYWPAYDELTNSQTGGCYATIKMHDLAEEAGIPIYWVDGNHENHEVLEPAQGDQWLRHLPRGHRWQWWGKNWMAVGGGVSVDKDVRTPGYDWFPEEVLSTGQMEYCLREGNVDIVVAHDTVAEVEIPGIHGLHKTKNPDSYFPPNLIAESEAHRALMSIIAKDKKPEYWFHGHYHVRYNGIALVHDDEEVNGMIVIGLDKNRSTKAKNTVIITRDHLTGELL